MGFKIRGAMQVLEVASNQKALEGFKVQASKDNQDLEKIVGSLGLKLEATDKTLYFRCKMLGYDFPNGNGDAVPRVYAADFGPSFIGKILDVNHQTDPEHVIGKILTTFHVEQPLTLSADDERIIGKNVLMGLEDVEANELQLEGICMIDRTTVLGDDIAKKLLSGVLTMVSQEANTDYAQCTVCAHKMDGPFSGICAHLDYGSLMIKAYPVEGKKHKVLAYKEHHNPVGTGLGVVTVGAYSKADVLDMVANLKAGKIKPEEAVAQLEIQERVFGKSPLLIEASQQVMTICADLGVSPTVLSALKKLDGVEALALMKEFGKIKAEATEVKTETSTTNEEEVKLDPGAQPTPQDEQKSETATQSGEALGVTKDTAAVNVEELKDQAKKEAAEYAKTSDEEGKKESVEPPKVEASAKHELVVGSLHDAKAHCSGCGWSMSSTGERTREEIEEEFNRGSQHSATVKAAKSEFVTGPPYKADKLSADGKWFVFKEGGKHPQAGPFDSQQAAENKAKEWNDDNDRRRKEHDAPDVKAAKTNFPIRLTNGKWRDVNGNSYEEFDEALRAQAALEVDGDDERGIEDKMIELGRKWKGPHGGYPQYLPMSGRWRDVNGNSYDTYDECEEASVGGIDAGLRDIVATFFRDPQLAKSYWLVADKDGKALGRFTLGAIAGGKLNRKVDIEGSKIELSSHLQSPEYGKDLVAHAKRFGSNKVLAAMAKAEKALTAKPRGQDRQPVAYYGDAGMPDDSELDEQIEGNPEWLKKNKEHEAKKLMQEFGEGDEYDIDNPQDVEEFIAKNDKVVTKKAREAMAVQMATDSNEMDWDNFQSELQRLMDKFNTSHWKAGGKGMGWQNRSGEKEFEASDAKKFLDEILPKTDTTIELYDDGDHIGMTVSHHDAPMGEFYEIYPADREIEASKKVKAVNEYELDNLNHKVEAIEQCLANDEASTDEELIQHFMSEMKLDEAAAREWVGKRGEYLLGILAAQRWGKDKNGKAVTRGTRVHVNVGGPSSERIVDGDVEKIDSDGAVHVTYDEMVNGYGYGEHGSEDLEVIDPNAPPKVEPPVPSVGEKFISKKKSGKHIIGGRLISRRNSK